MIFMFLSNDEYSYSLINTLYEHLYDHIYEDLYEASPLMCIALSGWRSKGVREGVRKRACILVLKGVH